MSETNSIAVNVSSTNYSNVTCSNNSEDEEPSFKIKKRILKFSDSENDDSDIDYKSRISNNKEELSPSNSDKADVINPADNSSDDGAESDSLQNSRKIKVSNRVKVKKSKLKQKFKTLTSSKDINKKILSESDDDVMTSIDEIKKKIKDRMVHLKSTIYDPDTSDDDENIKTKLAQKKPKILKVTSSKHERMSSKQAMENMKKIKSESNRMLREKEVSLPYHRPKALSLKDIMSRRKPAVSADGKAFPLKMNGEQLQIYAKQLEVRQKEMIELCKSDTEEENDNNECDIKDHVNNHNDESLKESPKNETTSEELGDINKNEEMASLQNISDKETSDDANKSNKILQVETTSEELTDINKNDEITLLQNISDNGTSYDANKIDKILQVETTSEELTDINQNDEITSLQNISDKGTPYDANKIDNILQVKITSEELVDVNKTDELSEKSISETEEKLLYNDSVESVENKDCSNLALSNDNIINIENSMKVDSPEKNTKKDSQLISLHYSESIENNSELTKNNNTLIDRFSDDDMNMEDIDKIIEEAEIISKNTNFDSPMLIRDSYSLSKPKLAGAPGILIDLDGNNPLQPKKLSGVELLKERFVYFAKLKTPEELEKEREKRIKPGVRHIKLKQKLEEQIAEQRYLEWTKRLEEEKQQHEEYDNLNSDNDSEEEIDKIKNKINNEEVQGSGNEDSDNVSNEELDENDCDMSDKPRKHNPMIDDEAEVSESESEAKNDNVDENSSSEEESESEVENNTQPRKNRILKAFEDSDDEDKEKNEAISNEENLKNGISQNHPNLEESQEFQINLAQKSDNASEDLFSQNSGIVQQEREKRSDAELLNDDVISQFSILHKGESHKNNLNDSERSDTLAENESSENLNAVVGMCPSDFTQNVVSQTQEMGDDILALCTGKFYNNEFISQDNLVNINDDASETQEIGDNVLALCTGKFYDNKFVSQTGEETQKADNESISNKNDSVAIIKDSNIGKAENIKDPNVSCEKKFGIDENNVLQSILDELDPDDAIVKSNKYFPNNIINKTEKPSDNGQAKKKFIIESDDESDDLNKDKLPLKKKKRKPEMRALQISDDEEEDEEVDSGAEEVESDLSDEEHIDEKLVEYDSEENEVEIKPQNPKKKRKGADFLDQEAELTSEDEWMGSGDEDEAGLDRMEREEGDDDTFNQGRLQRELGQIHMRDVLDQDKREVRLLQELLFEDGDLGAGGRQRKFRWKDMADPNYIGESVGAEGGEFVDSQVEIEEEEKWRRERYERENFLKQMKENQEVEETFQLSSLNSTTIVQTSLNVNTSTKVLQDVNNINTEQSVQMAEEKKTFNVSSIKKGFPVYQQNYTGSLLGRGQGSLARLAKLAAPLASAEDDEPKTRGPSSKRNFVFAAITPESKPKVTKRKADTNTDTPKLLKKIKTDEKRELPRNSLMDHM